MLKELVQDNMIHSPWLTRNMVSHYIINYTDNNLVPLEIVTGMNNQTVVSGLTDASPIDMAMATAITTPTGTTTTQESVSTSKRGGRPTGITHGAIEGREKLVWDAVDECAIDIASLKTLAMHHTLKRNDGTRCRVPWGAFERVTKKVCAKYNLHRIEIQIETVFSRNKVGRKLKVRHCGTTSPVVGIEGHLLAAILRRSALRQPVSCAEGLELANSTIEGTETQVGLVNWKKKHLKNSEIDDSFGSLGTRYWQNFCRRNATVISAKEAVIFDSKRDDWCCLDSFEDMYYDVYEKLWEAGIAEKLDEAVWRDKYNNIVGTQAEAYG
jgi:hypothetical protein